MNFLLKRRECMVALAAGASAFLSPGDCAGQVQITTSWLAADQAWSNPANWSSGTIPNNSAEQHFDVVLPARSTVTGVNIDIDPTIDSLIVIGGAATPRVTVPPGRRLQIERLYESPFRLFVQDSATLHMGSGALLNGLIRAQSSNTTNMGLARITSDGTLSIGPAGAIYAPTGGSRLDLLVGSPTNALTSAGVLSGGWLDVEASTLNNAGVMQVRRAAAANSIANSGTMTSGEFVAPTLTNTGSINVDPAANVTLTADSFQNDGIVRADGASLHLRTGAIFGTGTIEATNSFVGLPGTRTLTQLLNPVDVPVSITGGTIESLGVLDNAGQTLAYTSSTRPFRIGSGGVIRGGALITPDQTPLVIAGPTSSVRPRSVIDGLQIDGLLEIQGRVTYPEHIGLMGGGTIRINGGTLTGPTSTVIPAGLSIRAGSNGAIGQTTSPTLINGDHTLGTGMLTLAGSELLINGSVSVTPGASLLTLRGGYGAAAVDALNPLGGQIDLSGKINTAGQVVTVGRGASVWSAGASGGVQFNGGTIQVANGGSLHLRSTVTINDTALNGTFFAGAGAGTQLRVGPAGLQGDAVIFASPSTYQQTFIEPIPDVAMTSIRIGPGIRLQAGRTSSLPVVHTTLPFELFGVLETPTILPIAALVIWAPRSDVYGEVRSTRLAHVVLFDGDVIFHPGSRLTLSELFHAAGTLDLSAADETLQFEFYPGAPVGTRWEIISAQQIIGRFDNYPDNLHIEYTDTTIAVTLLPEPSAILLLVPAFLRPRDRALGQCRR